MQTVSDPILYEAGVSMIATRTPVYRSTVIRNLALIAILFKMSSCEISHYNAHFRPPLTIWNVHLFVSKVLFLSGWTKRIISHIVICNLFIFGTNQWATNTWLKCVRKVLTFTKDIDLQSSWLTLGLCDPQNIHLSKQDAWWNRTSKAAGAENVVTWARTGLVTISPPTENLCFWLQKMLFLKLETANIDSLLHTLDDYD